MVDPTVFIFCWIAEPRIAAAHLPMGDSFAFSYTNLCSAFFKFAAQDQE